MRGEYHQRFRVSVPALYLRARIVSVVIAGLVACLLADGSHAAGTPGAIVTSEDGCEEATLAPVPECLPEPEPCAVDAAPPECQVPPDPCDEHAGSHECGIPVPPCVDDPDTDCEELPDPGPPGTSLLDRILEVFP